MIAKFLLLTLFAVCQSASREPWWIQMFFPNVSFTGKYHPSNYKVEKSPLFPDYVQNSNDVWSPAYWMPYKQAYAQYWIDLIENSTKPEQGMTQENLAQQGNQYNQFGQNQYGQNQYGQYGQNQYGQYGQNQYGQYGQNQYDQYEQNQYGQNQYDQNQEGTNNQNQNNQNGQNQFKPDQELGEEAKTIAEEVQAQTQNMNSVAQQIVTQVEEEAEKQKEAVLIEANQMKEEVAAEAEYVSSQAQQVSAQINQAAEAKIEAINEEVAQFEKDVNTQFAPLNEEAEEIVSEAAEIAEKFNSQL